MKSDLKKEKTKENLKNIRLIVCFSLIIFPLDDIFNKFSEIRIFPRLFTIANEMQRFKNLAI